MQIKKRGTTTQSMGWERQIYPLITDDTDLGHLILTCIADNEKYFVKDKYLKSLIFHLVKENMRRTSLIIIPNLMWFIGHQSINYDQTQYCGFNCKDYFDHVPNAVAIERYKETDLGHITVAQTTDHQDIYVAQGSREVIDISCSPLVATSSVPVVSPSRIPKGEKGLEVYNSNRDKGQGSKEKPTTNTCSGSEKFLQQDYKRLRIKAKVVKFSDFKNTDPELRKFREDDVNSEEVSTQTNDRKQNRQKIQELYYKQRKCFEDLENLDLIE